MIRPPPFTRAEAYRTTIAGTNVGLETEQVRGLAEPPRPARKLVLRPAARSLPSLGTEGPPYNHGAALWRPVRAVPRAKTSRPPSGRSRAATGVPEPPAITSSSFRPRSSTPLFLEEKPVGGPLSTGTKAVTGHAPLHGNSGPKTDAFQGRWEQYKFSLRGHTEGRRAGGCRTGGPDQRRTGKRQGPPRPAATDGYSTAVGPAPLNRNVSGRRHHRLRTERSLSQKERKGEIPEGRRESSVRPARALCRSTTRSSGAGRWRDPQEALREANGRETTDVCPPGIHALRLPVTLRGVQPTDIRDTALKVIMGMGRLPQLHDQEFAVRYVALPVEGSNDSACQASGGR